PQDLTRAGVPEVGPGVVETLLDVEDLQPRPVRVEVTEMERVSVAETGGIEAAAVVVDNRRSVHDLVPAVSVEIADAQVVVPLAAVRFVPRLSVVAVEGPAMGELPVPVVPRGQHRAGVVAPGHHQARPLPVEVGDRREVAVRAVAPAGAPAPPQP